MAQGSARTLVNLLMAAMVLAWSVSPPPVQHTHAGGTDLSHRHGAPDGRCPQMGTSLQYHGESDHGPFDSAARVPIGLCGKASHLHVQWFGFRLTLPDHESPTKKGHDHSTSELLFIQAQASRAPASQVHSGNRLDTSPALLSLDLLAAGIAGARSAVSCSLVPAASHPLCDRARHERSGVLLA